VTERVQKVFSFFSVRSVMLICSLISIHFH
jgi:hypothetical protein